MKFLIFSFLFFFVAGKPVNIILILTDDQDYLTFIVPLTKTYNIIQRAGAKFSNSFATTPICCPSRSSLLTGLYQHNHGVLNNSKSGGCYGEEWRDTWEPQSLGPFLQAEGYRTFYAGKYLNQYRGQSVPPGWDWWAGLEGNSVYYNYTVCVNGTGVQFGDKEEDYLTDVISGWSLDFLRIKDVRPFLMVVAPPAPHEPFTPSKKYENYPKYPAPQYANFNTGSAGKHWLVRSGRLLTAAAVEMVNDAYGKRLATLSSVDDLVAALYASAPPDTFFIFTSDHGFHLGQFSQPWDKRQPYEADIRIPLAVWGPEVPAGATLLHPVLNIDIAPTLYELADVTNPPKTDGQSFLSLLKSPPQKWDRSFLIEYHGEGGDGQPCFADEDVKLCSKELCCNCFDAKNNSFTCVRKLSQLRNTIYCQFHDDEQFIELYDLNSDPFQLNNLAVN